MSSNRLSRIRENRSAVLKKKKTSVRVKYYYSSFPPPLSLPASSSRHCLYGLLSRARVTRAVARPAESARARVVCRPRVPLAFVRVPSRDAKLRACIKRTVGADGTNVGGRELICAHNERTAAVFVKQTGHAGVVGPFIHKRTHVHVYTHT